MTKKNLTFHMQNPPMFSTTITSIAPIYSSKNMEILFRDGDRVDVYKIEENKKYNSGIAALVILRKTDGEAMWIDISFLSPDNMWIELPNR